jgi:hypothetical protein
MGVTHGNECFLCFSKFQFVQFVFMLVDNVIVDDFGHQHGLINKTSET